MHNMTCSEINLRKSIHNIEQSNVSSFTKGCPTFVGFLSLVDETTATVHKLEFFKMLVMNSICGILFNPLYMFRVLFFFFFFFLYSIQPSRNSFPSIVVQSNCRLLLFQVAVVFIFVVVAAYVSRLKLKLNLAQR